MNDENTNNVNVNDVMLDVSTELSKQIDKLETLLTLPMDYIKSSLSQDGLLDYIKVRTKLIHVLEMVEVLVYDTHEEVPTCICCGAKAELNVKEVNGKETEVINGEISHWIQNNRIIHDFTCSDCVKKARG